LVLKNYVRERGLLLITWRWRVPDHLTGLRVGLFVAVVATISK
jgi:hypothetical protein